ncbi:TetR/AcrR family transcriptional regulator [Marinactinospora thermotolerans]|uniref:Transcriptional regulator, TetR family n=1 Tax=Marinactinospora thermotolerans DSM 45154 TaxID=1122192 RepID=A0A1T4QHI7_9ACTN|nr:TetR family transcriptional regulator [Marinactinospora thermotolerans]SKA02738.1 transcriptional regulator, TetR family [Marinactinospora thermotolerans DSM 45154]
MTERGERRKAELVETAVDIILGEGFAALSHRAVAARAGVPLGSTTYYFDSLEDLTVQALVRLGGRFRAHAEEVLAGFEPGGERELAAALVRMVAGPVGEPGALAFYERYVQAGRHPAYAGVVRDWNTDLVRVIVSLFARAGRDVDSDDARLALALTDGLLVNAGGEGVADPEGAATTALAAALPRLFPA